MTGAGAYVVLGLIHLAGHIVVISDLHDSLIGLGMKTVEVGIFGMRNSIMSFLNGFSVSMAFLMIMYGFFNLWLLEKRHRISVYAFNIFVAGIFTAFSFFWFDTLLVFIYGAIFLLFAYLLLAKLRIL